MCSTNAQFNKTVFWVVFIHCYYVGMEYVCVRALFAGVAQLLIQMI